MTNSNGPLRFPIGKQPDLPAEADTWKKLLLTNDEASPDKDEQATLIAATETEQDESKKLSRKRLSKAALLIIGLTFVATILTLSAPVLARVNPLKVITENRIRPEIVPALIHRGNGNVLLAAASGSDREEDPATDARSTLYMRSETAGEVSITNDNITCQASEICSGMTGCPGKVPDNCSAPSSRAMPIGPPLLFNNSPAGETSRYEAFFLLFDPPADICGEGDTWLLRIATDEDSQELLSAVKYGGTRATGMSVVGGGLDLAITQVGKGQQPASVFTISNTLATGDGMVTPPVIEVWREVRET